MLFRSDNYVYWAWKAGGAAVTNNNGSISSQVSANPTSGFSVVTYTGNGSASQSVGHGLGVAPSMVIIKCRGTAATHWPVYHTGGGSSPVVFLDLTNAGTSGATYYSAAPTSTVINLGTTPDGDVNGSSRTYVAYCWAAIPGFSAFGSYTGNGSTDGPFVFCGFRPAYLITKRTDSSSNWYIWDKNRLGYNGGENLLYAEATTVESSYGAAGVDFLSNGFKLRNTDSSENASGGTYIYAAFADVPFKYALAR